MQRTASRLIGAAVVAAVVALAPVVPAAAAEAAGAAMSNQDWWPERLNLAPLRQNSPAAAAVALVRCDESDLAVTMLAVVPINEAARPLAGLVKVIEARVGVRRNVFQCAEP